MPEWLREEAIAETRSAPKDLFDTLVAGAIGGALIIALVLSLVLWMRS